MHRQFTFRAEYIVSVNINNNNVFFINVLKFFNYLNVIRIWKFALCSCKQKVQLALEFRKNSDLFLLILRGRKLLHLTKQTVKMGVAGETLKKEKIQTVEETIRLLGEAERRLLRPNSRRAIMMTMILKSEINSGLYCNVRLCFWGPPSLLFSRFIPLGKAP